MSRGKGTPGEQLPGVLGWFERRPSFAQNVSDLLKMLPFVGLFILAPILTAEEIVEKLLDYDDIGAKIEAGQAIWIIIQLAGPLVFAMFVSTLLFLNQERVNPYVLLSIWVFCASVAASVAWGPYTAYGSVYRYGTSPAGLALAAAQVFLSAYGILLILDALLVGFFLGWAWAVKLSPRD